MQVHTRAKTMIPQTASEFWGGLIFGKAYFRGWGGGGGEAYYWNFTVFSCEDLC